ncbi:MAG: Methyltransferase protein [Acidobacteriota bacterium]|nr:Methyltransferase protein [Acidobacteriota bacterium]
MEHKDRVYYSLRTHLEMLRDRVRCLAYQRALASAVQDKIVLDVGCGSGILSLFAARAGAKLVLAVDMDIPPGAEEVARANGLAACVQFFQGNIRDIELPVDSVDIIVSEWMGGLLLMEDMLPAVLYARDRWLKPGGILLPDRARLFLAPLGNVAGIDSKNFPTLRETISAQMWVVQIDPSRFLAEPACILDLDLDSIQEPDVKSYQAAFRFAINKVGVLNGFGLWFDVLFSESRPPVLLSTAPWLPPTHWGQTMWILPTDIDVSPGDNVSGLFSQTKISPSTASFRTNISVQRGNGEKTSFAQDIEASPSNMNPAGADEERIGAQAISGAYKGKKCLWIGCSMSFAALAAARNGAKSVSILNHSPWAARAMQQLADQEGLSNIRFLSEVPSVALSQSKDIQILGAADSSWQALISHIKARTALNRTSFPINFFRLETPWKEFYGFDFSAYARHDIEMFHEDKPLINGLMLGDITGRGPTSTFSSQESQNEEIIYTGMWISDSPTPAPLNLLDGTYNCVKVGFHCGTVVLPLPGPGSLVIDYPNGKPLEKIELIISIINGAICRFVIKISSHAWMLQQEYEQPLVSMGHIVRN